MEIILRWAGGAYTWVMEMENVMGEDIGQIPELLILDCVLRNNLSRNQ